MCLTSGTWLLTPPSPSCPVAICLQNWPGLAGEKLGEVCQQTWQQVQALGVRVRSCPSPHSAFFKCAKWFTLDETGICDPVALVVLWRVHGQRKQSQHFCFSLPTVVNLWLYINTYFVGQMTEEKILYSKGQCKSFSGDTGTCFSRCGDWRSEECLPAFAIPGGFGLQNSFPGRQHKAFDSLVREVAWRWLSPNHSCSKQKTLLCLKLILLTRIDVFQGLVSCFFFLNLKGHILIFLCGKTFVLMLDLIIKNPETIIYIYVYFVVLKA